MRVLVACEESQRVTAEFRKAGHEAYSCDLLPTSGKHPEWHIQADALEVAKAGWDAVIAFPPCTHLAVSGAAWFDEKRRDGRQYLGMGFFLRMVTLPVRFVAVENPVGIMSTEFRKPDQIVQPWMFGHAEQKATCLWLKNLPKLVPTDDVSAEMGKLPKRERERVHYLPPSPERSMLRSRTYPGIAKAMGEQWGGYLAGIEHDGFTGRLEV